jgi:valyl-tRNA synthetase
LGAAQTQEFETMQAVVRAIRNWRAENNRPNSLKLEAVLCLEPAAAQTLQALAAQITHLANLERLEFAATFARPKTAARIVHQGIEIFLLNVIQIAEERKKMEALLAKARNDLRATEGKLANANFVSRAPANVVEIERQKVARAQREIELLEKGLQELQEG